MKKENLKEIGLIELSKDEAKKIQGGLIGWFFVGFFIGVFIGAVTTNNEGEPAQ